MLVGAHTHWSLREGELAAGRSDTINRSRRQSAAGRDRDSLAARLACLPALLRRGANWHLRRPPTSLAGDQVAPLQDGLTRAGSKGPTGSVWPTSRGLLPAATRRRLLALWGAINHQFARKEARRKRARLRRPRRAQVALKTRSRLAQDELKTSLKVDSSSGRATIGHATWHLDQWARVGGKYFPNLSHF